ncbi:NAD(P)H-binding protein [Lonepinella koalarum]|uniref:NAD(P)H dehydrogenase (Quinone) n=1 Tax=Lonepinella koalarum TaxID=53417 RepID=A0A4R1L306_9PAST|nr:NmrA family NAD(P)-binding protein [Lonepinella koalarum]MDH2926763.1 NAD(P)-dependent oxidoreductase [Lonepinella koalarum]TCK70579.1 NAD(P)H dehydrogenase (quinone) [Lonepinella koalarum]TFJ90041.1 NAD(P)-dependent oxidoreductase [Lonepinella koalarum]TYG33867.1 NAD(P)H-binding protein [Lonepinella koalarum]
MKYLVTGADGKLAGRVAEIMLEKVSGNDLIFTVPNLARLNSEKRAKWEAQGVMVLEANYDNQEQMMEVFSKANRIFFISSILNGPKRVEQHRKVITACVAAKVQHVTYTSFFGANREGYNQYVLPDHRATEKMLKESGLTYNIMRNNLYMENYLTTSVMLAMLSNNVWGSNAGEGKVSCICKDDSAECGAALLLGKGEPNKDYDLTCSEALSQREMCEMIAEKSGIPFVYKAMNDAEFLAYLQALHIPETTDGDFSKSPLPFCSNDMVTNEGGIAEGQMGIVTHDVEKLTGHKPREVRDLLDEYSYVWKNKVSHWRDLY